MKTRADKVDGGWAINGRKHYITSAHAADFIMVMAVTDQEKRTRGGVTAFLVDKGTPGFEITRVPYKGNGTAIGDLIGGHITMMVLSIQTVIGNVKAGTLRALAVTTAERSKILPDVPTISESAVPGFGAAIRYGLAAPAGTPRPIIDRLNRELRAALASDELREKLAREEIGRAHV